MPHFWFGFAAQKPLSNPYIVRVVLFPHCLTLSFSWTSLRICGHSGNLGYTAPALPFGNHISPFSQPLWSRFFLSVPRIRLDLSVFSCSNNMCCERGRQPRHLFFMYAFSALSRCTPTIRSFSISGFSFSVVRPLPPRPLCSMYSPSGHSPR